MSTRTRVAIAYASVVVYWALLWAVVMHHVGTAKYQTTLWYVMQHPHIDHALKLVVAVSIVLSFAHIWVASTVSRSPEDAGLLKSNAYVWVVTMAVALAFDDHVIGNLGISEFTCTQSGWCCNQGF